MPKLIMVVIVFVLIAITCNTKKRKKKSSHQSSSDRERENIIMYLHDINKFGLFREVTDSNPVYGVISARKRNTAKTTKIGEQVTSLKKDLTHHYLVLTSRHLHYLIFDGEKCILNNIFIVKSVTQATMKDGKFSFYYNDNKVTFFYNPDNGPLAIGYPRFKVHEFAHIPICNDRRLNKFVRQYFSYEMTNNIAYTMAAKTNYNQTCSTKNNCHFVDDIRVRENLMSEFIKRLNIKWSETYPYSK